jgi:hypothetical protein
MVHGWVVPTLEDACVAMMDICPPSPNIVREGRRDLREDYAAIKRLASNEE